MEHDLAPDILYGTFLGHEGRNRIYSGGMDSAGSRNPFKAFGLWGFEEAQRLFFLPLGESLGVFFLTQYFHYLLIFIFIIFFALGR